MTRISPYLHVLDGRLRIKLPQVKGAPQRALAIEQLLLGLDGVTDVTANPTTGNVLVLFTSAVISQHDIIAALQKTGYLSDDHEAMRQQSLRSSCLPCYAAPWASRRWPASRVARGIFRIAKVLKANHR